MSTETQQTGTNVVDLSLPLTEVKKDQEKTAHTAANHTKKATAHKAPSKAKSKPAAKASTKSNGKKTASAKSKAGGKVKKIAKAVKEKVKRIAGTKAQAQVGKDLFKYAQAQAKAQSTKEHKVKVAEVIRGYIYAGAKKDGYKEPESAKA
jgi:hypothetical protein